MSADLPERPSGKVLLVDDERRVLLFCANEALPHGGQRTIWFLTGGGAEPGESFAECAARELFEETGLRVAPEALGPVVAVRAGSFSFLGSEIWSNEAYFFWPVASWDVDDSGFTELERALVTTHRWWTVQELRETAETVFPRASELATLVEQLLNQGCPHRPFEFSW